MVNKQILSKISHISRATSQITNRKLATSNMQKYMTSKPLKADADFYKNWHHFQGDASLYNQRSENHGGSLQQAVKENLLNENTHVIDIFDFDKFHARLEDLFTAFHEPFFTHAMAIKSQSISGILCYATENFGNRENSCQIGIEGASINEVLHGYQAGFKNQNMIYDSPVKTPADLEHAISQGFHVNLDNAQDFAAVEKILKKYPHSESTFGVRINPLAGEGAISTASTAGIGSKFGLIFHEETFEEILGYFQKYPFLQGVHCHVGSQGCSLELLANGARIITEAAEKLNQHLGKDQVNIVDIGGGVPTSYTTEFDAVPFIEYRKVLEKHVPQLLSGKFRVITEFGRAIFTKCGTTVSKVFTIKEADAAGSQIDRLRAKNDLNGILFVHVGSNVFFREVYQPESWRRRFTIYNSDGSSKKIEDPTSQKYDIAGPLCFQGDYLCKEVYLPKVQVGDLLMMHDTGGYSMSLYSKYNSLQAHDVYGFSQANGFKLLKPAETREQCLSFWGPYEWK